MTQSERQIAVDRFNALCGTKGYTDCEKCSRRHTSLDTITIYRCGIFCNLCGNYLF